MKAGASLPRVPRHGASAVVAALGGAVTAALLVTLVEPALHDRMMPWILGRGLGLAAYLDIVALALVGTWFRHPWRWRRPVLHPAVLLRLHVALAVAACILVAGHVIVFALDSFAGVGWLGVIAPGKATYRPFAVGLGSVSLYLGAAIGITAALAGRFVGRHWLAVHRLALLAVALAWLHSVLAGSDTGVLRPMYVVTGGVLLVVVATRFGASRLEPPSSPGQPSAATSDPGHGDTYL